MVDRLAPWLRGHRGAVVVAGLVSFAGPTVFFAGATSVMDAPDAAAIGTLAGAFVVYGALLWALLLVLGHGFWRLSGTRPRIEAALAALFAAGAVGVAEMATAETRHRVNLDKGVVSSRATMQLYSATFSFAMTLLFFAHLQRSRAQEAAAQRLAAAQAGQRALRRHAVEASLKAVQARIDPQLLFDMLEEVRRCYETDAPRAEQVLDQLIAFLRAALPRLRTASSSLAREAEVARAYVRLRALAGGTQAGLAVAIAPGAAGARFPPGVLVPLVADALRTSAAPCALAARIDDGETRVELALPAPPSDAVLDRVRDVLDGLHAGSTVTVAAARAEAGVDVCIRVSHEHA
jgi:hypothetical protein